MLRLAFITAVFIVSFTEIVSEKTLCDYPDADVLNCLCRTTQIGCRGRANSSYEAAWNLFETVPNTTTISFTTYFDDLPTKMLPALYNLEQYECGFTKVTRVPSYSFYNLNSIQVIDLSYNKLITVEQNSFNNLPNVKRILLNTNQITTIEENAFNDLPKLVLIVLAKNNIEELPNVFKNLNSLKELDLSFNQLKTLNYGLIAPISKNFETGLSEFFVFNNSLICDCNLQWIRNLIENTESQPIRFYRPNTNCTLPDGTWIKLVDYNFDEICGPEPLKRAYIPPATTTIPPTTTTKSIKLPTVYSVTSINESIIDDISKLMPQATIILNIKELVLHNPIINHNYYSTNATTDKPSNDGH